MRWIWYPHFNHQLVFEMPKSEYFHWGNVIMHNAQYMPTNRHSISMTLINKIDG
jgi:hypothetical protein